MTVAEAIAEYLYTNGIRVVFGLPGGETVELLDALRRRGIRFILVHNESSALFMADTYSRLTRTPGAVLTTLGPGATNAVVGTAHAFLDRAPILLFTAQKPDVLLPDYTHQVLDLHALFTPITKGSFQLKADGVYDTLERAFSLLRSGRPGPVHLQISNEDAKEKVDGLQLPEATSDPEKSRGNDGDKLTQARDLLRRTKRPIIIAGLGLEPERPYTELKEAAEALNAPVIVTPKAKGALPEDHPLSAGTIGLTRTDPVYEILEEADCIIAVGFDVVELVKPWQHDAPVIWLSPWENLDPIIPTEIEFIGSMAPVLTQLADSDVSSVAEWGIPRIYRQKEKLKSNSLPEPQAERIFPQSVLELLQAHLPADGALAVDVGSHKIHSSLDWISRTPNRFFLSNGLSSMGYALPAAIGASLALPGIPVVCLTGDAGMAMAMGELGVLASQQLPVLVLVLNDGAIDLIRSHQVRVGKPVYGTEFSPPNFSQIGKAYGIESHRITDVPSLDNALKRAILSGKSALLEIMLDPTSYPTAP